MSTKKIAICFLSRKDLFNQDVWNKYFDLKLFNIYIYPDTGYELRHFTDFQLSGPYAKSRGHKILAIWYVLSKAVKDKNYKYVLLSDDCYPITSPQELYRYCLSHDKSNIRYLDSWVDVGHPRWISELKSIDQKANGDWWAINHKHSEILVESFEVIKDIYCRYSDDSEHAISCILNQHSQLNNNYVINQDIMYENYNFIEKGGNYASMCDSQINQIIETLRNKHYYFLRKFYPTNHRYSNHINYTYWPGAMSR